MEVDWCFDEGVETLINQINTGLRCATYTRNPMSGGETVDTAMRIVLRTGLSREAYASWHQRQPGEQTWYNFQQFMREQCRLHRLTSATAGSFGFGGNANEATEDDARFEGFVANVGAAHAANQNVVQTLVHRNNMQANAITQMQQQISQLAAAGVQVLDAPPVQYQQQPYNPRQNNNNGRYGRGGGRGNGRGGGGQGAGRGGARGG